MKLYTRIILDNRDIKFTLLLSSRCPIPMLIQDGKLEVHFFVLYSGLENDLFPGKLSDVNIKTV